jgi:AcrR family transcriptional regulator
MDRQEKLRNITEQRVREIMSQAKEVFLKKGYFAATMEEIAKLAGASKGTVYNYFKNKDDLYVSLMMTHFEEYARLMREFKSRFSVARYPSACEVLREIHGIYCTLYRHDPDALRIMQTYVLQDEDLFLAVDEKTREKVFLLARETRMIVEEIMSECAKSGLLPQINVRQLVDALAGAFLGIFQLENQKFRRSGKDHTEDTMGLCFSLIAEGLARGRETGGCTPFSGKY